MNDLLIRGGNVAVVMNDFLIRGGRVAVVMNDRLIVTTGNVAVVSNLYSEGVTLE